MSDDQKWFDRRAARIHKCPRCRGSGTVTEPYALAHTDPIEGAPANAIHAFVIGSFDICTACDEAAEISTLAQRPVSFEFIDQVVTVNPGDNPARVARAWWVAQYGESPEDTLARR